jgi:hypothetical protein
MAVCDDVTPGACDAVFIISMILLSLIASIGVWKFLISPCITNCFILTEAFDMTKDQRLQLIEKGEANAAEDANRLKKIDEMILKLKQRGAHETQPRPPNGKGVTAIPSHIPPPPHTQKLYPVLQYPNQCELHVNTHPPSYYQGYGL